MRQGLIHAQPRLEFIPPAFNPWVLRLTRLLLPLWLQSQTSLTEMKADQVEILADLFHQFQSGKARFLIAFRHPNPDDPYGLAHLVWNVVPQVARQRGITLQTPVHAHFMYDRGIPLWAGPLVEWLFPKLGGTPIQRGKVDRVGLKSARDLFANGRFPIAAAPEGGNNGHNDIVSPLEPGIAQLGFWCAEDLLKANRSEQVFIVPLGLQYHYVSPPWQAIEALLTKLETETGLSTPHRKSVQSPDIVQRSSLADIPFQSGDASASGLPPEQLTELYQRLFGLGEHLLSRMEQFYATYYHRPTTQNVDASGGPENPNLQLSQRLQTLLNHALDVAEQYFGLPAKGNVIDRCRRVEQAGWDWIYRYDFKHAAALSPVEHGLADRVAEEASLRMWHMRLVENFVAVTGQYVRTKPSAERFAETLLLLHDTVARIKGEHPFPRPSLGPQRIYMAVGQPLSVSARWDAYQNNRRQAVTQLTQDLQAALEALVEKTSG